MKSRLPAQLYKYGGTLERTIQAIVCNVVYFAHADSFNDPFDCRIRFNYDATNDDWRKFLARRLKEDHPEISADRAAEMIEEKIRSGCLKNSKYLDALGEDARQHLVDKTAVLSLSADPTQILMWSHYANSHKGCCLEFSTEHIPFKRARKVHYPPRYPAVSFLEVNDFNDDHRNALFVKTLFCNKAKFWKYEKEWRVLGDEPGLYKYDPPALTGIVFGHWMKPEDKDLIARLVEKRNPGVQLYQARPWKREFKMQVFPLQSK